MKQLNQNDIVTVAGGVYLNNLGREFSTVGLSEGCQNAFRVESNTYSSHWFSNAQLRTALTQCTDADTRVILNRLAVSNY